MRFAGAVALCALPLCAAAPPEVPGACPTGPRGEEHEDGDATSLLQVQGPPQVALLGGEQAGSTGETRAANSVPVFKINLDDPPRKRLVQIAQHYREELIAMQKTMHQTLQGRWSAKQMEEWVQYSKYDQYPDYLEEINGIVETVNDPTVTSETLIRGALLYEMQSPTYCSGVLWASTNGTVIHGRNMDYAFHFEMPDGRILNWPDVTFEGHVYKGGKPLYVSTLWPGALGLSTGMSFGGWSFEQQTRSAKNKWQPNLAAAKAGGHPFALVARHVMETTPDFHTAVQKLYAAKFMAPMYFVMAGAGAYEGAVLTIDRMGQHDADTPPIQYIGKAGGAWHLVQTNADADKLTQSPRREIANAQISVESQSFMTPDRMLQFMHTPLLFNPMTVYSNVMIPKSGYYKTALPTDPPSALNEPELKLARIYGLETWIANSAGVSSVQKS